MWSSLVLHFKTAADAQPAVNEIESEDWSIQEVRSSKMSEVALKSKYPEVIKYSRAFVKGKITSFVNSIYSQTKVIAGEFDHSKISRYNALST